MDVQIFRKVRVYGVKSAKEAKTKETSGKML